MSILGKNRAMNRRQEPSSQKSVIDGVNPMTGRGGVLLHEETIGSSHLKHRHEAHMLRLQVRGATINEWTKGVCSGRALLEPGALAFIPAGESHSSCINTPYEAHESAQMVALLSEAFLREVAESTFSRAIVALPELRHFEDPPLAQLLSTLKSSQRESESRSLFDEVICNAIAVRILERYGAGLAPRIHRGGIPRRQLEKVLEQIESSMGTNISLKALANTASMSSFHFSRAFKKSMGISPHRYALSRKIERAKLLLKNPDAVIGDISTTLGFVRQNHFSRVFRNLTGATPTEFRREIL